MPHFTSISLPTNHGLVFFVIALQQAIVGALAQASAAASCLLATRVHSEVTENRSASLVQKGSFFGQRVRARARERKQKTISIPAAIQAPSTYILDDPISQPQVAAGFMFFIIAVLVAAAFGAKPSMEGSKKRIPKQDEASQHSQLGETSRCSQPPQPSRAVTVHALNGLRVLFISNTILCHLFELSAPSDGGCLTGYPMQHYFKYMPMSFFTILSGFLRTTTNKEGNKGYGWKASYVYVARVIARLAPAYWIALVSVAMADDFYPPLLAWPVGAAFMQPLIPFHVYDLSSASYFPVLGNEVAWFVSCIVLCSFIFPLCYNISLGMQTHQKTWRAVACILVLLASRCTVVSYLGSATNFYARAPEFFMGMFLAQITSLMDTDFVQWFGWGWVFDILMIVYLATPHLVVRNDWDLGIVPSVAPLGWCALIVSAWAASQRADIQGKPVVGVLGKITSLPLLTCMAEYSFGAYIYQGVVRRFVGRVVLHILPSFYGMSAICSCKWLEFIFSWVVAFLSEKLVEKHLRF